VSVAVEVTDRYERRLEPDLISLDSSEPAVAVVQADREQVGSELGDDEVRQTVTRQVGGGYVARHAQERGEQIRPWERRAGRGRRGRQHRGDERDERRPQLHATVLFSRLIVPLPLAARITRRIGDRPPLRPSRRTVSAASFPGNPHSPPVGCVPAPLR
jgi:hypothetical protein